MAERKIRRHDSTHASATGMQTCPLCKSELFRIPRRSVDRFVSLFRPVNRYRCHYFSCDWEGNLRVARTDSASPALGANDPFDAGHNAASPLANRVPSSFVLSMVLSVAGIVVVVLASSTDWLVDSDLADTMTSAEQVIATTNSKEARPIVRSPAAPGNAAAR